jgi:DNA repair protein RecO (recombination protein O)
VHIRAPALVCSILPHGENGVVARVFTEKSGLIAGYVRGGRGRTQRPVLMAGNMVMMDYRARIATQLGSLSLELQHSRAPILSEPLAAAAIEWMCGLLATVLPEGQIFPALFSGASALLDAVEAAPAARGWVIGLVKFERLLLAELGYALALDSCIATGATDDLGWVSVRRAAAVSNAAAIGHEHRLLRLPAFMVDGADASAIDNSGPPSWDDIFAGLAITGHFLETAIVSQHRADIGGARDRLVDRLKRMVA